MGGRERHLAVDALGLVVLVTAASVQDRDAGVPLLSRLREGYFSIRVVCADGGYAGRLVDWAREKLRLTLEIVKRSDDTTGFVVLLETMGGGTYAELADAFASSGARLRGAARHA